MLCIRITAASIHIFAHTVYCLCVEEMKLVFRVIINMNIYHVLILRQEKYISSVCSPSFPVSNRKFTHSENNVILDNKMRVLIKNSIYSSKMECEGLVKNTSHVTLQPSYHG